MFCVFAREGYTKLTMDTYTRGARGGGFIKLILLIIVALIALGFFGYNLRDIVNSPTVRDNLTYVWGLVVKLWDNFLSEPAEWLFNYLKNLLSN